MATYSCPFYEFFGQSRQFAGVITADISLEDLVAQINELAFYKTGFAFLISRNGAFLAHPDREQIMRESIFSMAAARDLPQLREIGQKMTGGETGFAAVSGIEKNRRTLLAYAPVASSDWSVGVVIPEHELFADIKTLNHTVLGIGAAGFAMLIAVIVFIARSVTKPLKNLVRTTEEIAKGNLDVSLPPVHSRDEVQVLSKSVDGMRVALKEYIANIAETSAARERIESELKIAKAIQMNFLPRNFPPFPEQNAFDLFAALKPAREVGGDLYDFFMIDENHLFFSVGDVSDKGVPAALFMAVTKTLMKGIAERGLTPSQVLSRVNAELCQNNDSAMFVTLACGVLDISTGELQYSNAGHNPPVLIKKDKPPEMLPMPPGLVLGAMEDAVFKTNSIDLKTGDRLVLYTDGVTEAMDENKNLFSENRLLEIISGMKAPDPELMVKDIMNAVEAHASGMPQSDDITVMALYYKKK
jgi:sigma-B regulation protein RsbU (phosphoserine phosphatase)